MDLKIEIQNVVATSRITDSLDLDDMCMKIDGVQYHPDVFPGMVMRFAEPKCAVLLFKSGKVVCSGSKSPDAAAAGIERAAEVLRSHGIDAHSRDSEFKIQNIVANADAGSRIRLEDATRYVPRSMYEPELFPGMTCRILDPKCVILLFSSGRMVCVGAKMVSDVVRATHGMVTDLGAKGLLLGSGTAVA